MTTRNYTFSAFSGADIVGSLDYLAIGRTFVMPTMVSSQLTVTDDDDRLSGDSRNNEGGDDKSKQIADINNSGSQAHNDVKVYAEEHYTLKGSDGKTYTLVEIEIKGISQYGDDTTDFYTFVGSVPPPGVTLKVMSVTSTPTTGFKYSDLGAGNYDSNPMFGSGTLTGTVTEKADGAWGENTVTHSVTGKIAFTDNKGDTHTTTVTPQSGGYLGTLTATVTNTATSDGTGEVTWSFSVPDSAIDHLQEGQQVTQTYVVAVIDADGDVSTKTVTIKLIGKNDGPTAVADTNSGDAVIEQGTAIAGDPTATGNVLANDTDPDVGDTKSVIGVKAGTYALVSGQVATDVIGTYGKIKILADGTYTYTLNNSDPDTNGLAQGQVVFDTFTYTMKDGQGVKSTTTIKIQITGSSDAPLPVAVADTNGADAVIEEGVGPGNNPVLGDDTASGNVLTNDSGSGAKEVVGVQAGPPAGNVSGGTASSIVGQYGTLVLDTNGAWTYTLNDADVDTDALAQGATGTDVFTYTMKDSTGALSTTTLTINVTGTNDQPVITSAASDAEGSVTEAGNLDDGTPTAGTPSASDTLTSSDVDTGATATWSITNDSDYGTMSITTGGTWTFTLDNDADATQSLAEGESVTETFTATVTDDKGATATQVVTITIVGTNDAPVISATSDDEGAVSEPGDLEGIDEAGVGGGLEPTLAISPTAAAALNSLLTTPEDLEAVLATVDAEVSGGLATAIAVVWDFLDDNYSFFNNTVNEAFVRLGVEYVEYLQDGGVPLTDVTAKHTVDGVDAGSTPDRHQSMHDNLLGNLSSSAMGDRGFPPAKLAELTTLVGSTDPDLLTRAYYSGNEGTSDAAARQFDLDNGYLPTATGTIVADDVDNGAVLTFSGNDTGTYGSFEIDSVTGEWTYTLEDAAGVDHLAEGESTTESFIVTVTDDKGATDTTTVTITINGTNDAPVIGEVKEFSQDFDSNTDGMVPNGSTVTRVEGGPLGGDYALVSGAGLFTRFDGYRAEFPGNYAAEVKVYLDTGWANGQGFDYTVASSGSDGAHQRDFILHVTKDTSTGDLLVNASNNTNFAPREDLDTLGGTAEVTSSGWYTIRHTFRDSGGQLAVDIQLIDSLGAVMFAKTLSASADLMNEIGGNRYGWFTANNVAGGLAIDDVSLSAPDYQAPLVMETAGTPTPSANLTATGNLPFGDVDLSDTHATGATLASASLSSGDALSPALQAELNSAMATAISNASTGDGTGALSWTFTLDAESAEFLAAGEVLTATYNVTVTDENGASDTVAATVAVVGTNDLPAIGGVSTGSVTEDSGDDPLTTGGQLTITDPDEGQSTFAPQGSTAGTYGTFTLDADGTWTYTVDNDHPAVQGLAEDESITDSFTAVSSDGTANQVVTVTINGENDVVYTVNDEVDPSATKSGAGVELHVGSGIPDSGFGIATQTDVGVELGLQVIYRQGPTVLSSDDYTDGELHFTVNDGPQSLENGSQANNLNRAAWSFEYSIATGLNGETTDLGDFTFKLLVDVDPTAATSYRTFVLEPGGDGNVASSGYQWRDVASNTVVIADDRGSGNVTQNSQNYAFYQTILTSLYGPGNNFDGPAEFDIVLEASRGSTVLATNHIVVDVVESNDAPLANDDTASVTEDVALATNGNVLTNDFDDDAGDSKTVTTPGVFVGNYGTLTLNANGTYSYALDNANPDVQALGATDSVTDTFNYTMTDSESATDSADLVVTINGNNDTPDTEDDDFATDEATPISGNLLDDNGNGADSDIDATDTLEVTAVNGSGPVGSPITLASGAVVTVNADGTFDYDPNGAFDSLRTGQSDTDSFTYTISDGNGGTDTATVTINIDGISFPPQIPDGQVWVFDENQELLAVYSTTPGTDANGNPIIVNAFPVAAAVEGIHAGVNHTVAVGAGSYSVGGSPIDIAFDGMKVYGNQWNVDPRVSEGSLRVSGGPDESMISGAGTTQVFRIRADNVEINGFEIFGASADNITTDGATGVGGDHGAVISYNIVRNAGDDGLVLFQHTGGTIEYNMVYATNDGINVAGNNGTTADPAKGFDNTVQFNEVSGGNDNGGIYAYGSKNTTIHGNYVHDYATDSGIVMGLRRGFGNPHQDGGVITDNVVTNSGENGIDVFQSDVTVSGNTVSGSKGWGISIGIDYNNETVASPKPDNVVVEDNIFINNNLVKNVPVTTGPGSTPAAGPVRIVNGATNVSFDDNQLVGGATDNLMSGTSGDDFIEGRAGSDTMSGGLGSDTFVFDAITAANAAVENDLINGYVGTDDQIDLGGATVASVDESIAGQVKLTLDGDGDTITIVGANSLADITFVSNGNLSYSADSTLDASSTNAGNLYFGAGNFPTNFNKLVIEDEDVEIGLKIHYRQGDDIQASSYDGNGKATYVVPDGPQVVDPAHNVSAANPNRAAWSFDFSINTGLDGSTSTLDDFDFQLLIDLDPTAGVDYLTLDLEAGGTGSSAHHWEDSLGAIVIGDDSGTTQVTQNSHNYAFRAAEIDTDPGTAGIQPYTFGPGQFEIELRAYSGTTLLGSVQDSILVV